MMMLFSPPLPHPSDPIKPNRTERTSYPIFSLFLLHFKEEDSNTDVPAPVTLPRPNCRGPACWMTEHYIVRWYLRSSLGMGRVWPVRPQPASTIYRGSRHHMPLDAGWRAMI